MFKRLLVPLDHSTLAEQALGPAASIARASGATIDLVLVHAPWPMDGFETAPWNVEMLDIEGKYLRAVAAELKSGAGIEVESTLLRGEAVHMLREHAKSTGADLVVMTSHGRTGLSRMWVGSVADGLMRALDIPVLLLRPVEKPENRHGTSQAFRHVLVPLDGSDLSLEILPSAIALARSGGAALSLVEVVRPIPLVVPDMAFSGIGLGPALFDDATTEAFVSAARERLTKLRDRLSTEHPLKISFSVLVSPSPAAGILDAAAHHGADLIAMSTHGRGASRLFLGSVADKMIRAAGIPVLLRRPTSVAAEPLLRETDVEQQLPALAGHGR